MTPLDWLVLGGTLAAIVGYGWWKGRAVTTADSYLRGGADLRWWTMGLSIVATQASAITFLSVPGQAYEDGLGFIQFYFGLPIAMVLLSAVLVPRFHKLKLTTAYQFLELRFDRRTRQLVALLFLVSRGLASGLAIYAPALVLSAVLGWPSVWTNGLLGLATILYTVLGGSRAVSRTQTLQMAVILTGMVAAFGVALSLIAPQLPLGQAVHLAGALGKLDAVDLTLRTDTRYTLWAGLFGGLFLQLAYFGTDQSQVQRYLAGGPVGESRMALLLNGLVKIPMQLFILCVGVAVFTFYQLSPPPLSFNRAELERARTALPAEVRALEETHQSTFDQKRAAITRYSAALSAHDAAAERSAAAQVALAEKGLKGVRARVREVMKRAHPEADPKDSDFIFLRFVLDHFPPGLVGLLVAVILSAAMSANSAALSALGTTTVVDFFDPARPGATDGERLRAARVATAAWGAVAVSFAWSAALLDNLIQAVHLIGSLFYGPMLGVFLAGFFLKKVSGKAAFWAVLAGEAAVGLCARFSEVGYLWFNVIGCAVVLGAALLLTLLFPRPPEGARAESPA
jgi:SSS family transporter